VGRCAGPALHRPQAPQFAGACTERLHEEISADYNDMIYAATREEVERQRNFIRKWRLKHRPVADSLQEAGDGSSIHAAAARSVA
jgi:hypothetical protein